MPFQAGCNKLVNTLKQNVEPRGADAGRQIHAEVKTGAGLDRGVLAEESAVAHQLISMHDQKCMHAAMQRLHQYDRSL
jgi:hypothetical protein